jgi:hypothetical protein
MRYFKCITFSVFGTGKRTGTDIIITNVFTSTDKGKAIPLLALTGPEGSGSLRLPDFKTIGT